MRGLAADLVHAVRLYRQTPGSSLIAIAVLAAAMAIVTAFLALWSDIALKPPPGLERSSELVTVGQSDGRRFVPLSLALIERINEEATTVDAMAGVAMNQQYWDHDGMREPVMTELVTSRYSTDLRPRVQLGRLFTAEDHDPNGAPVVMLSHAFWQSEFGGRTDVLGEVVRIYGPNMVLRTPQGEARAAEKLQDYRIIGVLAPEISGTIMPNIGLWMPYEQAMPVLLSGIGEGYRNFTMLFGIARRAAGASDAAIRTELEGRYAGSQDLGVMTAMGLRFDAISGIVPNVNSHRETLRQLRLFLAGSVLLALVAACNVSLFLLSRAPGRQRELAIRMAVGAPLKRLARQLLTESALLVVAATVVGVLMSLWLTVFVRDIAFLRQAQWRDVTLLDWRVLGLVTVFMLLLTMLVSLAPVAGLKRLGIAAGSRSVTARAGWGQWLAGTAQVTVATMIGAAALAFVWYLVEVSVADRGFSATNVHVVLLQPPEGGFNFNPNEDALLQERERRREVVSALPGVERVAFGTSVPGLGARLSMIMPLVPPDDPQNPFTINVLTVDADYFELLGASLRDGRLFEPADRSAVIINTTLAQRLWGREDVAGEILPVNAPPGAQAPRWEIVGVIRDIAYGHPSADPELIAYRLITGMAFMESILIESTSSAADLQRELQRKIDDGELGFRINSIRSVEELSSEVFAPDRARTGLTAAAATLVVILAAFGFYGTQRFLVAAGRREYAIRGAVGAGPRALGRLVLARGLILGLPGLVLGGLLAFIVVAWMRDDFISETVPPLTVTALVTLAIMSILLVATLGPARQARKIEPAPLLREE